MINLQGKRILITGAAGAIGTGVSRKLKRAGAVVYGADRHPAKDPELFDRYLIGDLTDASVLEQLAIEVGDGVDVLINNLGGGFSKTLQETSREDYLFLWRLNFETTAMLCQALMPKMASRGGGKVINVATVLADNPLPTVSAYAASKAAVIAFTRSVALQFAPRNVQANVISPGYIHGPKNESYFQSEAGQSFAARFMPTGVSGSPDAVEGTFLYLASNLSDHVTGQVLRVDGGYSIW